ncbi:MAG: hypothetical protein P8181_08095, partial [bacterium]
EQAVLVAESRETPQHNLDRLAPTHGAEHVDITRSVDDLPIEEIDDRRPNRFEIIEDPMGRVISTCSAP